MHDPPPARLCGAYMVCVSQEVAPLLILFFPIKAKVTGFFIICSGLLDFTLGKDPIHLEDL